MFPGVLATAQVCCELPDGAETEGNEEQDGHDTHSSLVVCRVVALRRRKKKRHSEEATPLQDSASGPDLPQNNVSSGLTGSHGTLGVQVGSPSPTCLG